MSDPTSTQDRIPEKFFKHITGSSGIFEVRVEVGSDIFEKFLWNSILS